MRIATQVGAGTQNLHTRYSAYLDLPSIIPATDAANLIRYVEIIVAYRHPELHLLRLAPNDGADDALEGSNFRRYLFHIDVSTRADNRPDLLDAIVVEAAQALIAHCKPKDGRRPGIVLSRAESALLSEPGCRWCQVD